MRAIFFLAIVCLLREVGLGRTEFNGSDYTTNNIILYTTDTAVESRLIAGNMAFRSSGNSCGPMRERGLPLVNLYRERRPVENGRVWITPFHEPKEEAAK
jgi:hypothetical protein